MIYLIGVAHGVQYTNGNTNILEIRRFADFLEYKVQQLKGKLIAEEFNSEVLKEREATSCTARDVAARLDVEHRFCDPNRLERAELGIPSSQEIKRKVLSGNKLHRKDIREEIVREWKKYFFLREQFWFDRIKDKLDEFVFFICGADHITSFKSLLHSNGCAVEILVRDWEERKIA